LPDEYKIKTQGVVQALDTKESRAQQYEEWILSKEWRIKYKISWKSVEWEPSCSMQTDRRTDRYDKSKSRIPQFCEPAL